MKVLLLNVTSNSGSTGKIAYSISEKLNESRHKAIVAYGRRPQKNLKSSYCISNQIEVNFHALSTRVTGLVGNFSPIATRNFMKLVNQFKPDIVHIHEIHGYYINIIPVINYLKEKNIPIVWTFHCDFMFTGKCGCALDCNRWKHDCGNCPSLNDYPKSLYLDFTRSMLLNKKKALIDYKNLIIATPSEWLKERVKQSYLKQKEINVVRNGIDTIDLFYPRETIKKQKKLGLKNKKIVLSVAEDIMLERKGGSYIIELAKRMKDITFIVIGVDKKIKSTQKNLMLLERTYDQNELSEYYSMASVFVICSSTETFPTTCIEALACGTPVAGFDAGGTKETSPGELGEFVPYGNIEALQKAILKQIHCVDEEKRAACRKYAEEHYSIQKMYESYLEIYYTIKK